MFTGFETKDFEAFEKRKQQDRRYNAERRLVSGKMKSLQNDLNAILESRGFVLAAKVSQYWINRTKSYVSGIWLAFTDAEPYYIGSQLNCGIYENGVFAGIEISRKARADLNNVMSFASNNPDEFVSYFRKLDPAYRLLQYGNFYNERPDVSPSDLNDLLNAMNKEGAWLAFGEWYNKRESKAKEIFSEPKFAQRVANIFELLHPIYLVFSGRRPLGSRRSEKLLREPDVKNTDVARKETEIAPSLESLDPRELDHLVEQINRVNRQKTAVSRRGTTKTFRRNPVLSAALKIKYRDKCQICGITFKTTRGRFFTDTHHLRALKEGGTDTSDNIAVVCPNHHRILERSAVKMISRTQEIVVVEASGKLFEIKY
jgi:hypothetical protein